MRKCFFPTCVKVSLSNMPCVVYRLSVYELIIVISEIFQNQGYSSIKIAKLSRLYPCNLSQQKK